MSDFVYLDNNATTFIDPRVYEALIKCLVETPGNPSSVHQYGQKAKQALVHARDTIAKFLGVKSYEIVFSSGATEALSTLIRGIMENSSSGHIITSDLEHPAVFQTVKNLVDSGTKETKGYTSSILSPGAKGAPSPEDVRKAIKDDTKLIVLMAVNNETGIKTDIEGIARVAEEANIPFLVDGVALFGKELFSIPNGVSAMCFSGHKFHAPKGVGFSFIRKKLKFSPQIVGGGQQFNKRSGTENLPGIVALAKAVELLKEELPAATVKMKQLQSKLEMELKKQNPNLLVTGEGFDRVGNTSNLCFQGVDGESLFMNLDQANFCVSHGSACSSGALEPSRVLLNMGLSQAQAKSSLRFSISRFTTDADIDQLIAFFLKAFGKKAAF